MKIEDEREPYSDIRPAFTPKKRLKIGTFKVVMNGFKLGERFLKIVFDNAIKQSVHEVYVTIFNNDSEQERLIKMLSDWGFRALGTKTTPAGIEKVLVRDFTPRADTAHPVLTYPYVSKARRKFIVSIYPKYHTELLPDSILRTELPDDFIENRPNRNAIRKVFISRSIRKDMESGDIVVFYRTQDKGAAHYTSVATTVGVIDSVVTPVASLDDFVRLCRNRSVFSDAELKEHWDWNPRLRPFVVNFLYVYSFPKRPNFASLKEQGIITAAPRGFDEITDSAFNKLIQISNADDCFIVD